MITILKMALLFIAETVGSVLTILVIYEPLIVNFGAFGGNLRA
jgi:hypothetical protein